MIHATRGRGPLPIVVVLTATVALAAVARAGVQDLPPPEAADPQASPAPAPSTRPADAIEAPRPAPTTQEAPPEAQSLLRLIRQMGQADMPDPNDQQAMMLYAFRMEQAAKAIAQLKQKFPALAGQAEVRMAELAILFQTLQVNPGTDKEGKALADAIAAVAADADAPRPLKAMADYYALNLDAIRRFAKEPAAQPDQPPPWLTQELARRVAFGKQYKELDIGRQAFAEAILLTERIAGLAQAAPLLEQFIATYPAEPAAQASVLAQLAFDVFRSRNGGPDKAKPLLDRLTAEYKNQEITPRVLATVALLRTRSDPQAGAAMLEQLTRQFPGSDAVAQAYAAQAGEAYQKGDAAALKEQLAKLAAKFPASEVRAAILAELAFAEYQKDGLDAATGYLAVLEKDFPDSRRLADAMARIALAHLDAVGYQQAQPFVGKVIEKYGKDGGPVEQLQRVVGRYQTVGKPFVMSFKAADDRAVDLAQMRGQVVVVYFWATWCLPCVRQMDQTIGLAAKFHDRGVRFVGVSLDQDREALTDYLKAKKLPWPNFFDGQGWSNELAVRWGITRTPMFLVIDRQGNLADAGTSNESELEDQLQKLTGPTTAPASGLPELPTG